MNMYIKPSAMFITASGTGMIGASCTTSKEDLELLGSVFGIEDWNAAFATGEGCQMEYPIEEYCKFTAVENGVTSKVLGS